MSRRIAAFVGAIVFAAMPVVITTPAHAEDAPPTQGALDLSIRARALGIVPEAHSAGSLGLEAVKAPTGAGTTRMPQAVSGRESGAYIGVMVCEPDGTERLYQVRIDDAGSLPEGNLRGTPGPRGLYLPGRPTP